MNQEYIKEACVETIEEAVLAEVNGADRIEFCSHLKYDGLTPDFKETQELLQRVNIPVMVMIRHSKDGFDEKGKEFDTLKSQILKFNEIGITGFVFGFVSNGKIDLEKIGKLSQLAKGKEVCIHKCIDLCKDPIAEIEGLNLIPGITRVLSSGGKQTAWEGRYILKKMQEKARKGLTIMPGGKVTKESIDQLHAFLVAKEYHGRRIV